jgi:hypothetical protein
MAGWREGTEDAWERAPRGGYASDEYADDYAADDEGGGPGSRVTPFRFAIVVAFVGSVLLTAYALFVERTAIQVPILVSGLAVLGITLGILAVSGATGSLRAAEDGAPAKAFWSALLGGICAIGAAGALGSAVVFALIWGSAR